MAFLDITVSLRGSMIRSEVVKVGQMVEGVYDGKVVVEPGGTAKLV
jgi:hypothetical protein